MATMSGVLLPYDPQYVGHREAEKRRQETRDWLRRQELKLDLERRQQSPSVIPDPHPDQDES